LPSSKQEMALIGPIVRNEVFFFVVIFGAAALLILREWQSASRAKAAKDAVNDAERRLLESQNRRAKSWMMAASVACLAVILVLSADFAYTRANSAPPASRPIAAVGNEVRVPLSEVQDSNMHLYTVEIGGQSLRFMVIKKPNGYGTALDACRICGAEGYRQDGQNVVCRHCASAIYIPSIGDQGGCNPVGVASHIDGTDLVMDLTSLTKAASEVPK
jgi:high-affinity iron transporter